MVPRVTAEIDAMPDARRDDLTEQEQVAATDASRIAELLVTVEALETANAKLLAEKDNLGVWLPLKAAAADAGVPYETARSWAAAKKIESRRDGGRVFVGVNSLIDRLKRLGRRS
jgi:hypothetical protein